MSFLLNLSYCAFIKFYQIGPFSILALLQKYQIYEHPVFEQVIEETFYSLPEVSEMKGKRNPARHWNLRTPIYFN